MNFLEFAGRWATAALPVVPLTPWSSPIRGKEYWIEIPSRLESTLDFSRTSFGYWLKVSGVSTLIGTLWLKLVRLAWVLLLRWLSALCRRRPRRRCFVTCSRSACFMFVFVFTVCACSLCSHGVHTVLLLVFSRCSCCGACLLHVLLLLLLLLLTAIFSFQLVRSGVLGVYGGYWRGSG